MLEVSNLACMRGSRHLFGRLSFTLRSGDIMRLSGENGSGKSSLMNILCGLAAPQIGSINWRGRNVQGRLSEFHSELAYFGHKFALKADLCALDATRFFLEAQGDRFSTDQVLRIFEQQGLLYLAQVPVRCLSIGQCKRIALTRLHFCRSRTLWLLDEPFSALDQNAIASLKTLLLQHISDGGIVMFSSHGYEEINSTQVNFFLNKQC
ncbi:MULTISPECIES: cytochrome c biogenesis heme-transporting ATPase CcmA [unclassified Janthinobacterium]|uniref:cytochrome c biogenesis heme-transporting ATPase CcmA n=1 Tax=unclassified Janthinobacterium TaxID=2610881 RepID=UPI001587D5DF|nr:MULTISPECIES: cytochrome c biogenesis heme-transporting ATPase CcmA [unclassified Janthinobacterium]